MSIWGKIIGGAAGLALGGPLGALIGTAAGHAVDKITSNSEDMPIDEEASKQKIAFTIGVIVLSAKMAKADGVVTRDEITAFRKIFHIPENEIKNVGRVWDLARKDVAGFEIYANKISKMLYSNTKVLEELLEGLLHIATSDGKYHPAENQFIETVAKIFKINRVKLNVLKSRYLPNEIINPFLILDANPNWDISLIKKKWKQLVRECHPDKYLIRGLPSEAVVLANNRLLKINEAWEMIKKMKN